MKAQTAIITGATGGLGEAFARKLAKEGFNLLLTGRKVENLLHLKFELEDEFKIEVSTVVADLTVNSDIERLTTFIKPLDNVTMLVNNAGFGNNQNFFASDYSVQQQLLQVHVIATTRLVHEVVPLMLKNQHGTIINVASLAAFLPSGWSPFYCSSKAFMVAFSECLHISLQHSNIKVQALCPGFIKTGFHLNPNIDSEYSWKSKSWLWMSPEKVVETSLKSEKVICIPGTINQLIYFISNLLPRTFYYKISTSKTEDNKSTAIKMAA